MPRDAPIRTIEDSRDSSVWCVFLWNHFDTRISAPIEIDTVLAHAINATRATNGPNRIKHPIGKIIRDNATGAMNIRTKLMKFRCSTCSLVNGNVEGSLIAPDENKPAVVVRLRKNITTKLSARYTAKPTASVASGEPISVSNLAAARDITAIMPKIVPVMKTLILL
jgi:hypothetical protein